MTWTAEDVAKLKKAIGTGAKTVRFRDHTVELRGLDEMNRTLKEMEDEVSGKKMKSSRSVARHRRF